ncbi:MAG: SIS domain-containing protein [Bacteroidota bacterium]
MKERMAEILRQEASAIAAIPLTDAIPQAVELIYQQVHQKGGKIIMSGMGKAGQIGHNMATTFCSTGTPATFLHPSEAQHGDLGILQQNDLLFLISNSGKTREIIELISLAEQLVPDIPRIVISGSMDSPLAKSGAIMIHTGAPKEVCPLDLTPTTSTTVMTVIGDMLTVLLMEKIQFSAEDYARRHHSGYLNQKARNQFDT